ncbi:hypothetical protein GAYE_HTGSCF06PCTG21G0268 [Galdieria yellowstonensis]|uniref:Uncharacterized protein n=1 Tax=Galdieria yellowstonensis TaxID=3028027 RepID=A0AAV9I2N7_9RHOD|nr:hypothetical protein GAYE_HTGSCF06PCTG21G0268 [Galdieria yellowstonensis]
MEKLSGPRGEKALYSKQSVQAPYYPFVLGTLASVVGMNLGLDMSNISGANLFMPQDLHLDTKQLSRISFGAALGAIPGAILQALFSFAAGNLWTSVLLLFILFLPERSRWKGCVGRKKISSSSAILLVGDGSLMARTISAVLLLDKWGRRMVVIGPSIVAFLGCIIVGCSTPKLMKEFIYGVLSLMNYFQVGMTIADATLQWYIPVWNNVPCFVSSRVKGKTLEEVDVIFSQPMSEIARANLRSSINTLKKLFTGRWKEIKQIDSQVLDYQKGCFNTDS